MKVIFILLLFQITCGNRTEQEVLKKAPQTDNCDTSFLVTIEKDMQNLNDKNILKFLNAMNDNCKNNAEFMEYYNELLFKLTEKYPAKVVQEYSKIDNEKKNLILEQYSSSILDFNFETIINNLKSVKGNDKIKLEIVKAIEKNNQ